MKAANRKAAATGAWMFGGLAICLVLLGVFGPPDPDGGELNLGLAAGAIFGAISLRYMLLVLDPNRQDIERSSSIGVVADIAQGAGVLVVVVLGWIRLTQYARGRAAPHDLMSFGFVIIAVLGTACIIGLAVKVVRPSESNDA